MMFSWRVAGEIDHAETDDADANAALIQDDSALERVADRGGKIAIVAGEHWKFFGADEATERVETEFELEITDGDRVVSDFLEQFERHFPHGQRSFRGAEKTVAGVDQEGPLRVDAIHFHRVIDQATQKGKTAGFLIDPVRYFPLEGIDLATKI